MTTFVACDLDGTLLDLHLDSQALRKEIREAFLKHGIDTGELQPFYQRLEAALQSAASLDPALEKKLRSFAWGLIDASELESARSKATPRPFSHEFKHSLGDRPFVVYTNNHSAAAREALLRVEFPGADEVTILGRDMPRSLKPSGDPIKKIIGTGRYDRVFMIGDHEYDVKSGQEAGAMTVAIASSDEQAKRLDRAGAWWIVPDLEKASALILQPKLEKSFSFVYLAYNEEASVEAFVADAHRFGRTYFSDYEIIAVNDGSTDRTALRLEALKGSRLHIVTHPRNEGMGTSMKDGYLAARMDFCAHLPGDRQVRAQHLISFLPHMEADGVCLSTYETAHSGKKRSLMSVVFRVLVKYVGGLKVDFAGTYVMPVAALRRIPQSHLKFKTFVLSFSLLQALLNLGLRFHVVSIKPFRRDFGASKEARTWSIWKVFFEILKYRMDWLKSRFLLGFRHDTS